LILSVTNKFALNWFSFIHAQTGQLAIKQILFIQKNFAPQKHFCRAGFPKHKQLNLFTADFFHLKKR